MKIADSCVCCESTRLERTPAVLMPFVAKRVFDWDPVEITAEWGLRDLKIGNAYSICSTMHCLNCDALFLDMRFDDYEMGALYRNYRELEYESLREFFEPGYRERNLRLMGESTHIPETEIFLQKYIAVPESILDWGGGTGANTPFHKQARHHFVYDISASPLIEGAQRLNLNSLSKGSYDLIVSSHTLEHVSYPIEHLRQIVEVMSSKTALYIEVPLEELMRVNTVARNAAHIKRHWHEHINFFSEKSLRRLLDACGLKPLALEKREITVAGKKSFAFSIISQLA